MSFGSKDCRKRYTEEEKRYLLSLINRYKDVVECKETDAVSCKKKKKAWCSIQDIFNKEPDFNKRTAAQLQKCWENIKSSKRKALTREKQMRMGTGGGPYKKLSPEHFSDDATVENLLDDSTNIEMQETLNSDTIMVLNHGGEDEMARSEYTINRYDQTFEPRIFVVPEVDESEHGDVIIPPSDDDETQIEEPILQVQNEIAQPSNAATRRTKRKLITARQSAINMEVEARMEKINILTAQESEIHQMRKREAELKIEIQEEILRKAQIESSTAQMKMTYEEEIWKIRLELEKKTAEVAFKDFLKYNHYYSNN